jgi:hypothetical protein
MADASPLQWANSCQRSSTPMDTRNHTSQLTVLSRALMAIFFFGSIGTGVELILLEHTEDLWQQAPLVLLGVACAQLAVLGIRPSAVGVRMFQLNMIAFIAIGLVGVFLHYQGNVEFELELQPDSTGFMLFRDAMKGATPALAPGTMMLLGALGLLYTYYPQVRHVHAP